MRLTKLCFVVAFFALLLNVFIYTRYHHFSLGAASSLSALIRTYTDATLFILITVLSFWALFRKRISATQPLFVPALLFLAILFQWSLGTWAFMWQGSPQRWALHLLLGMFIVNLLWWLTLSTRKRIDPPPIELNRLRPFVTIAFSLILIQTFFASLIIATNAISVCPNFFTCQEYWFQQMSWRNAFDFLNGGLTIQTKIAVQMLYRYFSLIFLVYFIPFAVYLVAKRAYRSLRPLGGALIFLFILKLLLAIFNMVHGATVYKTLFYTGVTTLFLMSIISLLYKLFGRGWEERFL